MDDLLTILLVVGWVVLGLYQNSRKQKKMKEAKRQVASQREMQSRSEGRPNDQKPRPYEKPRPHREADTYEELPEEPKMEDILGELLGMPAKPRPVTRKTVSQPTQPPKAEPYSPLAYTPLIDQINKPQYESIEFREEHKTPGYQIEDSTHRNWRHPLVDELDLRQAVIYSAILHRPYT